MKYVVCYDVTDDRRRSRLSNTLLDYGARIQESVFVADLKPELAAEMEGKVRRLLVESQDKLHNFTLCGECREGD